MSRDRSVVPVRASAAAACLALLSTLLATGMGAAVAAGSPGSGVPAHLRKHNTDGWWYRLTKYYTVQRHLDGAGVTIALLDTSMDASAPEFRGANISFRQQCNFGHSHSVPVGSIKGDPLDAVHGTAMAAYLVGQGHGSGPGGAGILGMAPKAKLLFYNLSDDPIQGDFCSDEGEADLVRDAVRAGADIITTATGSAGDRNPTLEKAIRWAESKGVVVVAASGDTAKDPEADFPASYPGVVSVNAIDRHAKPWKRNPAPGEVGNLTTFPVISAPGVHTNALMWNGSFSSTGWATGTSPATVIVAGALALVKQEYPDATGNQLVQSLIHYTGARQYGWDRKYGFGPLALHSMVAHDPTKWPDVNPLLKGPDAAVKDYPMSIYGKTKSPAASGASADKHKVSTGSKATTANSGSSDGSGVPVWVWIVVGVVVIAGGGTGAIKGLRRKAA